MVTSSIIISIFVARCVAWRHGNVVRPPWQAAIDIRSLIGPSLMWSVPLLIYIDDACSLSAVDSYENVKLRGGLA